MEGITQEEIPTTKIDILTHSTNADLNSRNSLEEQQIQKAFQRFDEQDMSKYDRKMVEVLQQEITFLRQLIDFQNIKIDKLTTLVTEFIENKNHDSLISSIQQIHDHNQQQNHQSEQQQQVDEQHPQQEGQQEELDQQENLDPNVPMDSNMDPALHRVAVAAVAAAERDKPKKYKRKLSDTNFNSNGGANTSNDSIPNNNNGENTSNSSDYESKKPKIDVNFLHNPTTVKEIYDEFTKGFKGQPPLCEMDAKYGKHEWRGDSRSKESKRYQRRKKLCDAVDRGMIKYNKSAEEIIAYIEEFRGDKSLTWVMNGNLPPDISSN